MSFTQAGETIFPFNQMIERARIRTCVSLGQVASIADLCRSKRMLGLLTGCGSRLLDMLRHRVDKMRLIAERGEPAGVGSGASADVDDCGRRWRQVAENQFLRAACSS